MPLELELIVYYKTLKYYILSVEKVIINVQVHNRSQKVEGRVTRIFPREMYLVARVQRMAMELDMGNTYRSSHVKATLYSIQPSAHSVSKYPLAETLNDIPDSAKMSFMLK
jgi:hypothetical protein